MWTSRAAVLRRTGRTDGHRNVAGRPFGGGRRAGAGAGGEPVPYRPRSDRGCAGGVICPRCSVTRRPGKSRRSAPDVTALAVGDRVVLSWNPHCGRCFYCERAQPILCRTFLANGPRGFHFDGKPRLACDAVPVHQLMYLGGFSEYCVVPAQSAIRVPDAMPFDRAALIGCGVMTGVGAVTRIARPVWGDTAMVIGCGAVGLSAVQGCVSGWVRRDHRGRSQSGPPAVGSGDRRDARGDAGRGGRTGAIVDRRARRRSGDRGGRSKREFPALRRGGASRWTGRVVGQGRGERRGHVSLG